MIISKVFKIAIPIVLICMLFTGCIGYADINNSNIFTTVFADRVEDKDQYNIGGFVAKIKSKGLSAESGGETEVEMISGEGETLDNAFDNMDKQNANVGFYGAVRAVVMTDPFITQDITDYAVRLKQMFNSRLTVPIFTTNQSPDELFGAKATNNLTVGFELEGLRKTLIRDGKIVNVYLSDILQDISSGYDSYVIPSVAVDKDSKLVEVSGYSVFSEHKKVGEIKYEDSMGLCYLLSPHTVATHSAEIEEAKNSSEYIVYTKKDFCKIKTSMEDDEMVVDIDLSVKGKVISNTAFSDIQSNQIVDKVEDEITKIINNELSTAVAQVQTFASDYIGLTKRLRAKYGEDITTEQVNHMLPQAKFNLSVSVQLVGG